MHDPVTNRVDAVRQTLTDSAFGRSDRVDSVNMIEVSARHRSLRGCRFIAARD
jgi:hypothetical protein